MVENAQIPPATRDSLHDIELKLGPLPTIVKYFDDFEDTHRTIRDIENRTSVILMTDGEPYVVQFDQIPSLSVILKHIFVDWIKNYDPTTVRINWGSFPALAAATHPTLLLDLIELSSLKLEAFWDGTVYPFVTPDLAKLIRSTMHSLVRLRVADWGNVEPPRIRSLVGPPQDRFGRIRSGSCFLSSEEQARVTNHLEDIREAVERAPDTVNDDVLLNACMLALCNDDGLRSGQLARIETNSFRLFESGSVHYRFPRRKQQAGHRADLVTRKISTRWATLLREMLTRRRLRSLIGVSRVPTRLFFGLTPKAISSRVRVISMGIGVGPRGPHDYRHTAAQRLADSGATAFEIAEFLTHSSLKVAEVYVDSSPMQAEIINKALAISSVYSTILEVWKTRVIRLDELLSLPPDHYISGTPHGLPISGIGGCQTGQSLCSRNPVTGCYTCSRFMPLGDISIHRRVLEDFRGIVNSFVHRAVGDKVSPAYLQLQNTLEAVQRIIDQLERPHASTEMGVPKGGSRKGDPR